MTAGLADRGLVEVTPPRISEIFDRVATSVAVLTSTTGIGPVGLTVSSFCSLSSRPAALLACVSAASRTVDAIRRHGAFGLNVLSTGQAPLVERFAATDPASRFQGVDWTWLDDVPGITGSVVRVRCTLTSVLTQADQVILIGSPTALLTGPRQPLVRVDRCYVAAEPSSSRAA